MTEPHHDASKISIALKRTATLLEQYGASTERTIADWAAGASSSGSGPGQINAVSDPTGNAVTGKKDPLAGLHDRWQAATARLAMFMGQPWSPTVGRCRAIAGDLDKNPRRYVQRDLADLWHICCEFDAIVYMALPMDREAADELLREEAYFALPKDCSACESPTPELRSGYCDSCRKRRPRWDQLHPGEEFDSNGFKAWICADIAAGLITRPASPYSPDKAPRIHEHELEGRVS